MAAKLPLDLTRSIKCCQITAVDGLALYCWDSSRACFNAACCSAASLLITCLLAVLGDLQAVAMGCLSVPGEMAGHTSLVVPGGALKTIKKALEVCQKKAETSTDNECRLLSELDCSPAKHRLTKLDCLHCPSSISYIRQAAAKCGRVIGHIGLV